MQIITPTGARLLTREELISRLGGQIRDKGKRSRFERCVAASVEQADRALEMDRMRQMALSY